jgi:outer membrane protein assembly factor BamA
MRRRAIVLIAAVWLLASVSVIAAQEPATRAEALRREREEKAQQLAPPEPSRLERLLLNLENGRLFERILNPAEGLYPKIGNVTAGSGISLGPAYRKPALLGGHADFSTFAIASFSRYWIADARLTMPRLAQERLSVDIQAQRSEFPEEDFFGLGPDSQRDDHATFGLTTSLAGATAAIRPIDWLSIGGGAHYLAQRAGGLISSRRAAHQFTESDAPALHARPDFVRYQAFVDVNGREPRGNPRRGGRYALMLQQFDDIDGGRYSFLRADVDLQQYISLLRDRRVLALHALVSVSDAGQGGDVPFYLQRTLGGPDDLRGFRRFRFRDRHLLLLQAEYRWEIFTAVDGAIFYDAGKVASRLEDLNLSDLESDYGIGFRFGTRDGVFLRVEGAFGSSAGKHFILRFGHVF